MGHKAASLFLQGLCMTEQDSTVDTDEVSGLERAFQPSLKRIACSAGCGHEVESGPPLLERRHRSGRHLDRHGHIAVSCERDDRTESRAVSEVEATAALLADRRVRTRERRHPRIDMETAHPGRARSARIGGDQHGDTVGPAVVYGLHRVAPPISRRHSELDLVGRLPAASWCVDAEKKLEKPRGGLETVEDGDRASESGFDDVAHNRGRRWHRTPSSA